MSTDTRIHDPCAPDAAEGVMVERSADRMCIHVPRPASWHQQLAIAWQLHQIGSTTLGQVRRVSLDVAALDGLPFPLMKVLLAFEQDLRRRGCELSITGVRSEPRRNSDDDSSGVSCDPRQPLAASTQEPPDESGRVGSGGDRAVGETGREETKMSEKPCIDDFEQRLLDHVEMLYGVALKLTHNPCDAERITRRTMLCAWHARKPGDGRRQLKAELLKLLRRTFLSQSRSIGLRDAPEQTLADSPRPENRTARRVALAATP
jgi:hypothetical protein